MRYLIWGYYGHHNLGDDLMLEEIVGKVVEHDAAATFMVRSYESFSRPPVEGRRLESTARTRIARLLGTAWKVLSVIRKCDVLLIGGGTLFVDKGRFNSSMLYLAVAAWVSRRRGMPVHVLGVGIDTLSHPASLAMLRTTLSAASTVAVRDRYSLAYANGTRVNAVLSADLLLSPEFRDRISQDPGAPLDVVVCVSRYMKSWYSDVIHDRMTRSLVQVLRMVVDRGFTAREVILCPLQSDLGDNDDEYCAQLAQLARLDSLRIEPATTAADVTRVFGHARLTISMRYHALVFSSLLNRPFVGISVEAKTREICDVFGMPSLDPLQLCDIGVDASVFESALSRTVSEEVLCSEMLRSKENFRWMTAVND